MQQDKRENGQAQEQGQQPERESRNKEQFFKSKRNLIIKIELKKKITFSAADEFQSTTTNQLIRY